ncbi:MAG: hypothetical protein IPP49_04850 [Saprospiraceae bacterium]|nr:hypothetical protein [Saprospiraceae bacterium]
MSLLVAGALGYFFIGRALWGSNVNIPAEEKAIFIPSNSSFEDVVRILNDSSLLVGESSFRTVAGLMRYNKDKVPAGKYTIKKVCPIGSDH